MLGIFNFHIDFWHLMNFLIKITLIDILLQQCIVAYPSNTYRDLDICNHWNGRRHFLELGERGDLHARNVTTSAFRSTLFSPTNLNGNGNLRNRSQTDIWYQCNLELVTCADCVIRITFTHANFSKTCERIANGVGKPSMCPCEHIQFSEPPYDTTTTGQEFCGDGKVFRSQTRTLLLKFFYRATNSHVFSLQYFSERNVKIVSGSPKQSIISNYSKNMRQIISTPYFPYPYPRDYGVEHILNCDADNCVVRLDFSDFQLGLTSTMEIFDSSGQMLDSYTGEHFRPPIIVSSGKSLLLQFRGNGVSGVGFRAEVTFVSSRQLKENRLIPYTDCGGMVSGPGGAITMMNMIENSTDIRFYDCIWIIKPGNNYMMMKTHISLRVEEFLQFASRSELTIHQGTTSDAVEIENVVWPNNGMTKETHIVPILTGYYIRLRGVFSLSSKLAIVYSVFNYLNCYIGSEFLCGNNHCISIRLHCDGFDHCGDKSDEPETCEDDLQLQNDRRWYTNKPNYYFPKMEQYPDLKTATGIFIVSTLGIFAVLSGWMVILYRMGVRARHQRELQNHLQTISELLDRQEDMQPDEPPSYEAPPDYEEVIKVGMEQELREPRRRQRRNRRHRNCSRAALTTASSGIANETPTTSAAALVHGGINNDATNMQDMANRLLLATAACGDTTTIAATATTSKQQQQQQQYQHQHQHPQQQRQRTTRCTCKSLGISTSPASLSSGCELSDTIADKRNTGLSSGATSSQLEECIDKFQDDSLNISLTLAIPTTSQTVTGSEIVSRPKSTSATSNCTEQTYLKRSWIVVNDGKQNYKIQRLRHTFSSPEAFPADLQIPDFLNYGTNLPHDRSSFLSNASNFGSELSRDPSANSISQRKTSQNLQHCTLVERNDHVFLNDAIYCTSHINNNGNYDSLTNDDLRQQLVYEFDSDSGEKKISCFGAVNKPFRLRYDNGHKRSKSFTNTPPQHNKFGKTIKRSSSADLLMRLSPVMMDDVCQTFSSSSSSTSTITNGDNDSHDDGRESEVFLI